MVVRKERNEAGAVEFAGHDAEFICAVAESEGYKVTLEIIVTAHGAV